MSAPTCRLARFWAARRSVTCGSSAVTLTEALSRVVVSWSRCAVAACAACSAAARADSEAWSASSAALSWDWACSSCTSRSVAASSASSCRARAAAPAIASNCQSTKADDLALPRAFVTWELALAAWSAAFSLASANSAARSLASLAAALASFRVPVAFASCSPASVRSFSALDSAFAVSLTERFAVFNWVAESVARWVSTASWADSWSYWAVSVANSA